MRWRQITTGMYVPARYAPGTFVRSEQKPGTRLSRWYAVVSGERLPGEYRLLRDAKQAVEEALS